MATSAELAVRLSDASVRKQWDVYSTFDWPEAIAPEAGKGCGLGPPPR